MRGAECLRVRVPVARGLLIHLEGEGIVNNALKFGLLATGLGLAMNATTARAAVALYDFDSNAVNYCQAFTPGPANTVRNRVIGSENVGTATMNVACNFHSMYGAPSTTNPSDLYVYFTNNNTTGTITVSCTLLTGYQGQGGTSQYTVTKSVVLAAGANLGLEWHASDNPNAGATDFGTDLVGINCALPHGGVINDTYLYWQQDNGV